MPIELKHINLTSKPLTEFTNEDTIYISQTSNGLEAIYYCQFVKLERGVVYGKVLDVEPRWRMCKEIKEGQMEVKARVSKCFLWGMNKKIGWEMCHWFDSKTKTAE